MDVQEIEQWSWNKVAVNLTLKPYAALQSRLSGRWGRSAWYWNWRTSWAPHLLEGCLWRTKRDKRRGIGVRVSQLQQGKNTNDIQQGWGCASEHIGGGGGGLLSHVSGQSTCQIESPLEGATSSLPNNMHLYTWVSVMSALIVLVMNDPARP